MRAKPGALGYPDGQVCEVSPLLKQTAVSTPSSRPLRAGDPGGDAPKTGWPMQETVDRGLGEAALKCFPNSRVA